MAAGRSGSHRLGTGLLDTSRADRVIEQPCRHGGGHDRFGSSGAVVSPRRPDPIPCRRGSQRDGGAHKVALADLDTAMAQNIVGGRVMKIEVG